MREPMNWSWLSVLSIAMAAARFAVDAMPEPAPSAPDAHVFEAAPPAPSRYPAPQVDASVPPEALPPTF